MSLRRTVKLLGAIGDFARKRSRIDNTFFREKTKELGEGIRNRLLDGLVSGYDINGHQFRSLEQSTIEIRGKKEWRTVTNSSPLRHTGGIENFLSSADLFTTGTMQVKLNSPPEEYMIAQNEGFTPSKIPIINKKDKLVFIKNTKGINVPARKWFGIPKTYKEGGTKYNEFLRKITKQYERDFEAIFKSA